MPNVAVSSSDFIAAVRALPTFPITAGDLITSIRYQVPDPTVGADGFQDDPFNPDHNGLLLPAFLLYRWLWDGMRDLTRRCHWFVEDWWAMQAIAKQPSYPLDARWHQLESAFAYQFPCYPIQERWTIYPSQAIAQPLQYGWHRRVDVMDVFYWPTPDRTDPTLLLSAGVSKDDTILPIVSLPTGVLPFGWAMVDGEMIQYQEVSSSPPALQVCRRGLSGTLATVHDAQAPVYHCSLWVNGVRMPTQVTKSAERLEIPQAFIEPLETFVLAKIKMGPEQDFQAGVALDKKYREQVESIVRDPVWQGLRDGSQQVAAYGSGFGNLTLYGSDPFGVIVP